MGQPETEIPVISQEQSFTVLIKSSHGKEGGTGPLGNRSVTILRSAGSRRVQRNPTGLLRRRKVYDEREPAFRPPISHRVPD